MDELLIEYYNFINECIESGIPLDELQLDEGFFNRSIEEKISIAIEKQRYIGIFYKDDEGKVMEGFRLIEPLVLGRGFKRGDKVSNPDTVYLRGYVIEDTSKDEFTKKKFKKPKFLKKFRKDNSKQSVSKSGRDPFWRLFKLNRITRVQTFNKHFTNKRKDYSPNDKMMATILKSVPLNKLNEVKTFFKDNGIINESDFETYIKQKVNEKNYTSRSCRIR